MDYSKPKQIGKTKRTQNTRNKIKKHMEKWGAEKQLSKKKLKRVLQPLIKKR